MDWSDYQKEIFYQVAETNKSLIIEAVAGSGKTTTIVEAIKHVPATQTICFLAFNKALRIDQPVLTGEGWKAIGCLSEKDEAYGVDGKLHSITKIYHVGIRPMMKVTFSDETVVFADEEHLWQTETINYQIGDGGDWRKRERWKVRTTQEIAETIDKIHRVPHLAAPIQHPKRDLYLSPYLMGALLGDGSFCHRAVLFSGTEEEMIQRVRNALPGEHKLVPSGKKSVKDFRIVASTKRGRGCNRVLSTLQTYGLQGKGSAEKFIPSQYLFSSVEQRLELLRGLMDTDGCANGVISAFVTTSRQLADGVAYLCQSLGGVCNIRTILPLEPQNSVSYWVNVRLAVGICPFALSRKVEKWRKRKRDEQTPRKIVSIEEAGMAQAVCISIDSPDHLFLTAGLIPTHNSIADVLKQKVTSPNARCMTLHSAGFSAWRKYLGGSSWSCKVDSGKTRGIFQQFDIEDRVRYGAEIVKLVSIAKGQGIVPRERAEEFKGLVEDDDQVWDDMIDFYDLDRDGCSIEVAREVLSLSIDAAPGLIDFDDQLYMPIITGAPFDKYDVIFLDESQDINGIQAEIVDRMRKSTSRVIAVGDRHQAIYQFRGALSNSMTQIVERFGCHSLPLSISYRCAKAIVKKAQEYVSHIQSHELAPEGLVTESLGSWPLKNFLPTDVILCRNNRPLIEVAFLLIRNKVSCRVLGRDIGQGLVKLVKKMKAFNVLDLTKKLANYRSKEAQKLIAQGKEDKLASLDDKLDTLAVFMEEVGIDAPVSELISAIEALFSDDRAGRLTLSTVHKFKGGEADRVFILDPFLMPSKWARQQWQREAEQNLQYVAVTRAKKELYYVTSETLRNAECLENLDSDGFSPSQPTLT